PFIIDDVFTDTGSLREKFIWRYLYKDFNYNSFKKWILYRNKNTTLVTIKGYYFEKNKEKTNISILISLNDNIFFVNSELYYPITFNTIILPCKN
ncbi:MAG: hypothetical protein QW303_00105, partial [Nitrososphaerota archaeon]